MKFHSIKILIIILLGNIIALTGYYFIYERIKSQTKAASDLTSIIDSSQEKNSKLSSLRTLIKSTEADRRKIEGYLLTGDLEIPFIEQIETLAKSNNLAAKTNSVSANSVTVGVTRNFVMQVAVDGSWSNILNFLNQVENLPYGLNIDNVSVSKGVAKDKNTTSSWSATLDISVIEKI